MTMQPYDPPVNAPALINPTTDSWTAVLVPIIDLAKNICQTEFVPKDMRGNAPKVVAAILHSRELGLPPMTGLAGSHVIGGRPGISAELMRSLIEQAGHHLRITEMTAARCVMKGRRSTWADDDWTTVSYTMQEAERAGDARKNPNYGSRPAEMLLARCTTRLARMIFADVIHGMRSVEELQDMVSDDQVTVLPEQEPTKVSRKAPAKAAPAVEAGGAAQLGAAPSPAAGAGVAEEPTPPEAAPAPAERKRPPLNRRGDATRKAEPPAPQPVLGGGEPEPEVVDAEIVEDAPAAEGGKVSPLADARAELRRKVMATVQMQWERILGKPVDREERLWFSAVILGKPGLLDSTNDLTPEELRTLLSALERTRDREQLEARYARPADGGQ